MGDLDLNLTSGVADLHPRIDTLHHWCDDKFGWGPQIADGNALTICFCATVLEIPVAGKWVLWL